MTTFTVKSANGETLYEEDRTVVAEGEMTVNYVIGSSFVKVSPTTTAVLVTLPATEEDGEPVVEDPEADEEPASTPEPEPVPEEPVPEEVRY